MDGLCEWAFGHAAAAWSGGDLSSDEAAFMSYGIAVSSHAPFVSVEDGGGGQVLVLAPVPVLE